MIKLIDKLYAENNLTDEELLYLLDNLDLESKMYLFEKSRETKDKYYGNSVYMRGLIEFSNYCFRDCKYCGIRVSNRNADRYRLSKKQIMEVAAEGYDLGYRTFVMQSGEDPYFTDEVLCDIITSLKSKFNDIAITLSIGERPLESYRRLKQAGVDRYLLRHESADEKVYEALHPGISFANRRNILWSLKEMGFQTGAGFMVGLPQQDNKSLVKDLRFLKELSPEMVGIGPFIPHSETPLGAFSGGTVEKTLIMVALTRLMLPKVLLPSTTALGTLDELGREKALMAGANVVMPNLSPTEVREKYELYENKICTGDEAKHCRHCIEGRINSTGNVVDMEKGDHYDFK